MTENIRLSPFAEVVAAFKAGEAVVMVDDEDRENEGDVVIATEKLTPEAVAFFINEARGLVCVTISVELAEKLNLPLQTLSNNSPFQTPFTVSVDAAEVAGSGVTARARTTTMKLLLTEAAKPEQFVSPGHVFPLIANPAGVIGRQGQTEGSWDLARIAGLKDSAVICEILNPDGTMARGQQINAFAERHKLKVTSVAEVLKYRVNHEILVRELAQAPLETEHGKFNAFVFVDDVDRKEHIALVYGDPQKLRNNQLPLVRIHSECLTGDVFGSRRCDCGSQLSQAMKSIVEQGCGVLLYLRQEGRGIGLGNKLRAYALQDQGHDTVEANVALGFQPDLRDFAVAAKILATLGVTNARLLTNNPQKIRSLELFGIKVEERVPLIVAADEYSRAYLEAKRQKLGHLF